MNKLLSLRLILYISLAGMLFLTSCSGDVSNEMSTFGTIELNGITEFQHFSGGQQELVEGVHGDNVTGLPALRHVYLVAPNILAITIDEFGFIRNESVPYQPETGDDVTFHGEQIIRRLWDQSGITPFLSTSDQDRESIGIHRFVHRDGKPLGHLVGKEGKQLWPVEPVLGKPWDRIREEDLLSVEVYITGSGDDKTIMIPKKVYRKTKPHGKSNVGPGYGAHLCNQHQVYFHFDEALPVGQKITLDLSNLGLEQQATTVLLDHRRLRTEAIQVNQAGYHPGQNIKYAFLSTWMGPGGGIDYNQVKSFSVLNEANGKIVLEGKPRCIAVPQEPDYVTIEDGPVNLARTYVYVLDFSALTRPGNYRIHVPGLGVSFPFPVSYNTWDQAARLQMMGFYHQRSGILLGPPASDWERPRNFHPADRYIHDVDRAVYFDKAQYSESQWRAGNPFARLQKSMLLDTNLPEAYGGWADAADYDRRIPHLRAVMAMLFLYEINPEYFEQWSLPLPEEEKTNTIPDIIDEALWCTELFRRSQLENGEVIEGIESIAHPKRGEPSWLDSHPTSVKPGTPAVAYKWAGVAARMSKVLKSYDPDLAGLYKDSALRSMTWVKNNLDHPFYTDFQPSADDIMQAGVYLYQLTGDQEWHDLFQRGWEGSSASSGSLNRYNPYPILSYALMPPGGANRDLQVKIRNSILSFAEILLEGMNENSAFLLRPRDQRVNFSIVEQLGSEYLIGAHLLSGKEQYLEGLLKCSLFSMGANPLNLCYITGMGQRFIEPFYLDYEYAALPVPAGIPAYGPVRLDNPLPADNVWGWHERRARNYADDLEPSDIRDWPLVELYFRYVGYPAMNEYTIQQGMREQITRWAYLAQHFQK